MLMLNQLLSRFTTGISHIMIKSKAISISDFQWVIYSKTSQYENLSSNITYF